ncbi:MAG: ATP-binding protein [Flavobacteriaceae bacterium]
MKPKKIVITGGPSTGKTVLIEALKGAGFSCFPEVIREMTAAAKKNGALSSLTTNPINSVADPNSFNKKIISARLAHYLEASKYTEPIVFFDRGLPDVLAYMDYYEQEYQNDLFSVVKKNKYDTVFLLPMWQEIFTTDEERFEGYEDALKIHDCLQSTYESLNYQVIEVPKTSVLERVDFIRKKLHQ